LNNIRDCIESRPLQQLYDYWQDKRAGRTFPARRDLDPLEFRFALGNVLLIDVTHNPLRFRFRLFGANLVYHEGIDPTGLYLEELPLVELRQMLDGAYRHVVAAREPVRNMRERVLDGRMRRFEALLLPLSSDGETVDMIMIGLWFHPEDEHDRR
jgi:hypothetical protein